MKQEKNTNIFVDGSGADPNGVAGWAWLCEGQKPHIEWGNGWTNNEAEYRAVLSAVKALPDRTSATISCDSQLVIRQLRREWAVLEPRLWDLHAEIETAVYNKALRIHWRWIPRKQNKADKLLRNKPKSIEDICARKQSNQTGPQAKARTTSAKRHGISVSESAHSTPGFTGRK